MPNTLEILEQAPAGADVPCCEPQLEAPVAAPTPALPFTAEELQPPQALDQHDLELLCGVET